LIVAGDCRGPSVTFILREVFAGIVMPFYEYECPHCGSHAEVLQKITDKPLAKCPSCGKKGLKKLMSAPVFRLKGSGWYETDFKSDKENKRNLAGADKEEAKPESKPESKPAPSKEEGAKADAVKTDVAKPESKPAGDKPAASPVKRRPARARAKQKAARKPRR
jgi:putative FmdB family regulatory protein